MSDGSDPSDGSDVTDAPSPTDSPEAAVAAAAREFGFAEVDAGTVADEIAPLDTQLGILEPTAYENTAAGSVRPGEDPHNAFLYRCSLSGEEGPLGDLAVAVKDNLAVAGVPMTCGSEAVEFVPDYTATAVRRLVDAGASVVGTTNMDEFAYFTTGETCAHGRVENPAAEGRSPGGSSSGSAAAVAAGLADVALGSDTGGSVRIPASFCGVVGLKPTHRAVPRFGFADLAPSLDHVGTLADSVRNAARAFEAIAGPDVRDPSSLGVDADGYGGPAPAGSDDGRGDVAGAVDDGVEGCRLLVVEEAMGLATGDVAGVVEAAADDLAAAGATVERVSLPGYQTLPLALSAITGPEFAALVADAGQVYGTGTGYSEPWRSALADLDATALGDNVREQLLTNRALDRWSGGRHYVAAQNVRSRFAARVADALDDADALLTPTTPITAPEFGEITSIEDLLRTISNTGPFNLTGHPALSVPCGDVAGRPVGLQVVAERGAEATAVRVGGVVE